MQEKVELMELMQMLNDEAPELANMQIKIDIFSPKIKREDTSNIDKVIRKNYTKKCSIDFKLNDLNEVLSGMSGSTPLINIPIGKQSKSCEKYANSLKDGNMIGDVYCLSMKIEDEDIHQCVKIIYGTEELAKF